LFTRATLGEDEGDNGGQALYRRADPDGVPNYFQLKGGHLKLAKKMVDQLFYIKKKQEWLRDQANGGDGGDEGNGGLGRNGTSMSEGQDGTDGGNGGDATSGANGGNGGIIEIKVNADDMDLFMLLGNHSWDGYDGNSGLNRFAFVFPGSDRVQGSQTFTVIMPDSFFLRDIDDRPEL
jgi:hypothetical protein